MNHPSLLRSAFYLSVILAAAEIHAAPDELNVQPLAAVRESLKPQEYSPKQRELVAQQALMFIKNLYVHRELKIQDFGAQVDPVPRLENMVKKASGLSDVEFHQAMQKIFLDLHDHHTNYSAPLPLKCSYVLAPLAFADVYDDGKLKIIVSGKTRVLEKLSPETSEVSKGDELVAINGTAIRDLMEKLAASSGGANRDSMITGGIMNLSIIRLAELPVPKQDEITYTLRRDGKTFDVTSKYHAIVNLPSCVKESQSEDAKSKTKLLLTSENPLVKDFKKLVAPAAITPFDDDAKLPIGSIYMIKTPAGNLAKFDLETFSPEDDSSPDDIIHKVRMRLETLQPDAKALIIDLRTNGGGIITLAEGLTQLFTPHRIRPMPVRLLPNQLNLAMFMYSNQGHLNGWSEDTKKAIESNQRYTDPRLITSVDAANRYGQIWFKPVVVLTDANCYSACDLFAAAMQDHKAATIIGTHATTGAGGANVMDYSIFRQIFALASPDKNPFIKLPGGQGMRVSWRQTIRVGKNEGKLIEDSGISSDKVVRYVTEDIVGGESRVLMREIHKAISQILPRYASSIKLESSIMMKNGEPAKWIESVKGVDTIKVVRGRDVVGAYKVAPQGDKVEINLPDVTGDWSETPLQVIGTLKSSIQFRVIREIRWRGDALNADQLIEEDFTSGTLQHWHVFHSSGSSKDGWQIKSNSLGIGNGDHYTGNVTSQLFTTLNTEGREVIGIDLAMKMETEDGMDFVNIIVRDPETGTEEYVASLSGSLAINPSQPIGIPTGGKKTLELVFEFLSDENWHLTGPEISKLRIQTQ